VLRAVNGALTGENFPLRRDDSSAASARISVHQRRSDAADLAAQVETPRPFLEEIQEAEPERNALLGQIDEADRERRAAEVLRAISAADVRTILSGLAGQLEAADRESLKDFLSGLVERIDLTADASQCVIHYRISTGDSVASPRGFEPRLPP
jgi:hypothetical protein